jgi:hypothetical protein
MWKQPWTRVVTMVVVCACAIVTAWHTTHPPSRTVAHVVQVRQGDGYLTDAQCREIDRGTRVHALRDRYGVPAQWDGTFDTKTAWWYPIRDTGRFCQLDLIGTGDPDDYQVDGVRLDLIDR